jgi:hypothetical protein
LNGDFLSGAVSFVNDIQVALIHHQGIISPLGRDLSALRSDAPPFGRVPSLSALRLDSPPCRWVPSFPGLNLPLNTLLVIRNAP